MIDRWFLSLFILTFLFFVSPPVSFAGTTGKIAGQVTDEHGLPLPGASITIENTTRGAVTDEEGIYFLLSVPPGRHTLVASMIGYTPQRQENLLVTSDFTTNQSFQLKEANLQLDEIIVEAQAGSQTPGLFTAKANAPLVETDMTATKYIVRAEDIGMLSNLHYLEEFVALQGGVSLDAEGSEINIRSGRTQTMAYYIDGIQLPVKDYIYSKVYQDFNRLSLQEMTIITGGMEAEYGNAQSGVVHVVTRDGTHHYGGTLDYQMTPPGQKHWGQNVYESPIHLGNVHWDNPEWVSETATLADGKTVLAHPRRDYTGVWGHVLEGNLSGPLSPTLTFFLSTRWLREVSSLPAPYQTTPFNLNTTLKLSHQTTQNLKMQMGGFYDRRKAAYLAEIDHEAASDLSTTRAVTPIPGGAQDLRDNGASLFLNNPNPAGNHLDTDYLLWFSLTHMISPKSFYEIRASYSVSQKDTSDVYYPPTTTYLSEAGADRPITDRSGHYIVDRNVVFWDRFSRKRLSLKMDLSSQITRRHFIKTGFDITRFDNWAQAFFPVNETRNYVAWYSKTYEDTGFFPGKTNKGVTPVQMGTYLQDKIELDGMIINAGIRWSAFFPNTRIPDGRLYYLSPMWNSMTRSKNVPMIKGKTITAWSPRLGISHPMSEKSTIHFYIGRAHQFPSFSDLYENGWTSSIRGDQDLNQNGQIDPAERWNNYNSGGGHVGNPELPMDETVSFELGFNWNFFQNYVLGITTYYKGINTEIGNAFVNWQTLSGSPSTGQAFAGSPIATRDTRGFEFNFKKPFSHMVALNFALNMQWADLQNGSSSFAGFPDSLFVANGHYWTKYDIDPSTGAEIPISLREMAVREGKDEEYYIRLFGQEANDRLRQRHEEVTLPNRSNRYWDYDDSHFSAEGVELVSGQRDMTFYDAQDAQYWQSVNNQLQYPGKGEGNILLLRSWSAGVRNPAASDRRMFGSLAVVFASPNHFGPGNGKILSNMHANMIYRFYTGTPFTYIPLAPSAKNILAAGNAQKKYGPLHTRTDLNIEKEFGNKTSLQIVLGLEVFNCFNQKDPRSTIETNNQLLGNLDFDKDAWQSWGIQALDPVTTKKTGLTEIYDLNNYWDAPRELKFSVRIKW